MQVNHAAAHHDPVFEASRMTRTPLRQAIADVMTVDAILPARSRPTLAIVVAKLASVGSAAEQQQRGGDAESFRPRASDQASSCQSNAERERHAGRGRSSSPN